MTIKNTNKSKIKDNLTAENIFNEISTDDAYSILRILAREDPEISKRIVRIAVEYLKGMDIEDIACDVYYDLNNLEVEDVWERFGSMRYGYVDPGDAAYEMFEETLEPFVEESRKYQKLGMYTEAKHFCMGLLKGIYLFEKE